MKVWRPAERYGGRDTQNSEKDWMKQDVAGSCTSYQTLIASWWNIGVSWELQFHRVYMRKLCARFPRFNPLMIIVCTGNSQVFALDRTSVWFTDKVAATKVMRKQPSAGCHVNTPLKGFFLRHRMQVLCADQRRPSKTFKNTMGADNLFSRSHWNKTPRSFVQALWDA